MVRAAVASSGHSPTRTGAAVLAAARNISKQFPGVRALHHVDIDLYGGEIHGLVGGNGAGKSTLIKIMTGAETPDEGTIEVPQLDADGRGGIAAIYQELTIVPHMSVLSNVFLGRQPRLGPFLRYRVMRSIYDQIAADLGSSIDPRALAGSLSVANQQLVEIMRALAAEHRVLIMDEPTSSLGATERDHLYKIIRQLRTQGTGILYISHNLDEVIDLCDRISIMRDGRLLATEQTGAWNKQRIVEVMLTAMPPKQQVSKRHTGTSMALQVEHLRPAGAAADISFSLRQGEILGIAGLVGAGRTEILRALAGADPGAEGELLRNERRGPVPQTVRQALALGIALVPEDRKGQGIVGCLSGTENITLTDLPAVSTAGFSSRARREAIALRIAQSLRLAQDRLQVAAQTMSGGNQQKVVIGKWLHRRPDILLLDEPTRGIDVGAKAEVYGTIRSLAQTGLSMLVVSSELEELVENCDRILVVSQGRLIGELDGPTATTDRIFEMIFVVEGARRGRDTIHE
jgi:ABC-type sugar transport system ATPase subunit